MTENLGDLETQAKEAIAAATDLRELDGVKHHFLGRKGSVTALLRGLKEIPAEQRRERGREINELKVRLTDLFDQRTNELSRKERTAALEAEAPDLTLPGVPGNLGTSHPVTTTLRRIEQIFLSLGFSIAEGPEVETDYNNFTALNIPPEHPARDMHDTFYLKSGALLRTHTSPIQIRVMSQKPPPVAIIAPGRVYRRDLDVSHSPMFHQVEGLLVDTDVSFAHLKGILHLFVKEMFGPDTPMRLRPSYFPFVEPGAEVDIGCIICQGKGCRVCKRTGWLEVLGAGMVHPNVFRAVGYDPDKYTGFAFGMGVDRLAMLRYGIDDIRLLFENDLRFLRQFQ